MNSFNLFANVQSKEWWKEQREKVKPLRLFASSNLNSEAKKMSAIEDIGQTNKYKKIFIEKFCSRLTSFFLKKEKETSSIVVYVAVEINWKGR